MTANENLPALCSFPALGNRGKGVLRRLVQALDTTGQLVVLNLPKRNQERQRAAPEHRIRTLRTDDLAKCVSVFFEPSEYSYTLVRKALSEDRLNASFKRI